MSDGGPRVDEVRFDAGLDAVTTRETKDPAEPAPTTERTPT